MVTEIIEFEVKSGLGDEFIEDAKTTREFFKTAACFKGLTLQRLIDNPQIFCMRVEWTSVEESMEFANTPAFGEWRQGMARYFAAMPRIQHFETVV